MLPTVPTNMLLLEAYDLSAHIDVPGWISLTVLQ